MDMTTLLYAQYRWGGGGGGGGLGMRDLYTILTHKYVYVYVKQ